MMPMRAPSRTALRRLCLKSNKTSRPPLKQCRRLTGINIDRALGGKMNKEFPGYFEKNHGQHGSPHLDSSRILDLHGTSKLVEERKKKEALMKEIATHPTALTSGEVQAIVLEHHSVDECLVVDVNVAQRGTDVPVAFVVPKLDASDFIDNNQELHDNLIRSVKATLEGSNHKELERDLVRTIDRLLDEPEFKDDMIRDEIVQWFRDHTTEDAPLEVVLVDAIPKTASGKSMRGTLRRIAEGEPFTMTRLITDYEALAKMEEVIKKLVARPIDNETKHDM